MQNSKRTESRIRTITFANARFFSPTNRRRYRIVPWALALLSLAGSWVQQDNFVVAQVLSPLAPITDSLGDFESCSGQCIRLNFRDRVVESFRPLPPPGDMTQHRPYETNLAQNHTMHSSYYARPYQAVGFANSNGFDPDHSFETSNAFEAAEQGVRSILAGTSHEGYLEYSDWRRKHQSSSQPFIR